MLCAAAAAQTAQDAGRPEEGLARLPEIIVTAPSADSSLRQAPHSVSVITAEDIARSPAHSVGELLSREANLNLRSFYGSDKQASIDMRGMGEPAGSNVLILLDGVRLNELDLSGADLTAVPLGQIDRIEIVRGGGAVQYGNGAVAGVINIITRRASGAAGTELQLAGGSWRTRDGRARVHANSGPLALSLNLSGSDSDGYRANSHLSSRDAAGELRLTAPAGLDFLEAWLRVARHSDRNGFPGPVSAADFASGSAARRASATPNDFGVTSEHNVSAGLFADLARAGRLELQASHRKRDNDFVLGYTALAPLADQTSNIGAQRHELSLRWDKQFEAFGSMHDIGVGWQTQSGNYVRFTNGRAVPDQTQRNTGDVRSHAWFLDAIVRASPTLSLNAGLRNGGFATSLQEARYTRNCAFNPFPILVCTPYAFAPTGGNAGNWRNHASELGLSWNPTRALTVFASTTRQFRNPNLDELAAAAPGLRPQRGRNDELGARWTPTGTLELSATVFTMRNRDEIHYGIDPLSGLSVNRNYDQPTRRTGAELEARWQVTPRLQLRANLGHVVAKFSGSGASIPLVPRQTTSLEARWKLGERQYASVNVRHVGRRFDGNDQSNRDWPQLPAYTVADLLWRAELGSAEFALGVNNLFNRAYSTLGYSATWYPMPARSFTARLRYRW